MENSEFRVVRRNLLERIFGEEGKIRDIHELELFLRALTDPTQIVHFLELVKKEYDCTKVFLSKVPEIRDCRNLIDEFWLRTDDKWSFMSPLRFRNKSDMSANITPTEGRYLKLASPILATNEFSTLLVFGYGMPSVDCEADFYRAVLMGHNQEPSKFYLATIFNKRSDGRILVMHETNSEEYARGHPDLGFKVKQNE